MGLTPLDATYVLYEEGDTLQWVAAVVTLSPMIVGVALVTLCLFQRNVQMAILLLGLTLAEVSARLVKDAVNAERPARGQALRSDGGMPSSHSTFMAFLAVYVTLSGARLFRDGGRGWALLQACMAFAAATAVGVSRVVLHMHSWDQVCAGWLFGGVLGVTWSAIAKWILTPIWRAVERVPLFDWLRISDHWEVPDAMRVKYDALHTERMRWRAIKRD